VTADHTKWGTTGVSTIARLDRADVVISDPGLTPDAREALGSQAGHLIIAEGRDGDAAVVALGPAPAGV
jgi:DeoR/GlpR family transcriptional regulator of sugar metabolism